MPKSLGEWQWIDLQHRIQHHCAEFDHKLPVTDLVEPRRRRPFLAMLAISGSVTIIAVLLLSIFTLRKNSNFPAPTATVAVDIRTDPPWATVQVGDRSCVSPHCQLDLPPGEHLIEAHMMGFETVRQTIEVNAAQPPGVIALKLKP